MADNNVNNSTPPNNQIIPRQQMPLQIPGMSTTSNTTVLSVFDGTAVAKFTGPLEVQIKQLEWEKTEMQKKYNQLLEEMIQKHQEESKTSQKKNQKIGKRNESKRSRNCRFKSKKILNLKMK